MNKTLEKRLKVLEMHNGKVTLTEPALTPLEEAQLLEASAEAIAANYFQFEAKTEPSTAESAEFKTHVREALKNQPCGGDINE